MNRTELALLLRERNVDPRIYTLRGGDPADMYTMEEGPRGWSVYWGERGVRREEALLATEDEACRFMFRLLTGDDEG
jgi:hypothetical protein